MTQTAQAILKKIRVSPRKLNLIAASIRGMDAKKALIHLSFCRKRVALEVYKTLNSAIANAENNHNMDADNLFVAHAYVGTAMKLKRFQARGRGKSGVIEKPFAHLGIIVQEKEIF